MPEQQLSTLERQVLDRIQTDFPLDADPYGVVAADLGVTREVIHQAVQALRARGIIRRIGGSYAAGGVGYHSALVASRMAPDHLESVAAFVNTFPEVTHNYERPGSYNLWFTVIAESAERLEEIVRAVRACHGAEVVEALPATQTFKLRVDFQMEEGRA